MPRQRQNTDADYTVTLSYSARKLPQNKTEESKVLSELLDKPDNELSRTDMDYKQVWSRDIGTAHVHVTPYDSNKHFEFDTVHDIYAGSIGHSQVRAENINSLETLQATLVPGL